MEVLVGIAGAIAVMVGLWIKSLLGKIKRQEKKLDEAIAVGIVEKAKTEVLKEKIVVEKAIDEQEEEHVEPIREANDVQEAIGGINDAIIDFNTRKL
jgi:hypothetical protein